MSSNKSYLGVIVDVIDPLKQGRAKVKVFGIFDDLPVEDIPWAEPGTASEYFGGGKGGGAVSIPRIGTVVYCSFEGENYYKLFYSRKKGLVFQLDDATIQLDTQNGGELRVVIKMGEDEIRMENEKVIINSLNIELGEGAIESVIKGDTFKKIYDTHTHAGAGSPPVVPLPTSVLSKTTKTK